MKKTIEELEINGVSDVGKDLVKNEVVDASGLKAVLIRSYASGVHYGYLKECADTLSGRVVTLVNSRRCWSWYGAATLSQMALEGVKEADKCKFSMELPEIEIMNVIEIIPLSEEAFKNLNSVKVWKV